MDVMQCPSMTVRTSDGRTIGYGEFGDPEGKPIVFLHGLGDSRLTRNPDDRLTASLGVRLVTIDAPGIGLSDVVKRTSVLQSADDVRSVADSLGLDRFGILGWSAGGPRAL